MSTARLFHGNDPISRISRENTLLSYFSSMPSAEILDLSTPGRFHFRAWDGKHDGFGSSPVRRTAIVKAVSEMLEHRFVLEVFKQELSHIPRWLQTSNGFATHFDETLASRAAMLEAFERHILQMTWFLFGWNGFEELSSYNSKGIRVRFILSKLKCGDFRAGIVIATSQSFPGVSFGYLCDESDQILSSKRWTHAETEAIGKIEPWMDFRNVEVESLAPIEKEVHHWLFKTCFDIEFASGGGNDPGELPKVYPKIRTFNLSERWHLDFPFFAAYCDGLLPLLVPARVKDKNALNETMAAFGIRGRWTGRNPIL